MPTATPPDENPPTTAREVDAAQWLAGQLSRSRERVAEEVPIALVYNGVSHAVMMATPADLDDFALGFSLTEGILRDRSELYDVEIVSVAEGVEVQIEVAARCFAALKERRRNLTGRTGCGICGTESLQQAVRHPAPVESGARIAAAALQAALGALRSSQALHETTGATHAAGWARSDGTMLLVREDVGRHNALDKLIGAMERDGLPVDDGFVVLTSRASYEMVQKAAMVGIGLVATVSAPTGLAIDLAEETGVTLVGFARPGRHTIYTHAERLI